MTDPLTVKKAIELLSEFPEDAAITIEGCDCWGMADDVDFEPAWNEVMITRQV